MSVNRHTRKGKIRVLPTGGEPRTFRLLVRMLYRDCMGLCDKNPLNCEYACVNNCMKKQQHYFIIYSPGLKHNIPFLSHNERLFIFISINALTLIPLMLKVEQKSVVSNSEEKHSMCNCHILLGLKVIFLHTNKEGTKLTLQIIHLRKKCCAP